MWSGQWQLVQQIHHLIWSVLNGRWISELLQRDFHNPHLCQWKEDEEETKETKETKEAKETKEMKEKKKGEGMENKKKATEKRRKRRMRAKTVKDFWMKAETRCEPLILNEMQHNKYIQCKCFTPTRIHTLQWKLLSNLAPNLNSHMYIKISHIFIYLLHNRGFEFQILFQIASDHTIGIQCTWEMIHQYTDQYYQPKSINGTIGSIFGFKITSFHNYKESTKWMSEGKSKQQLNKKLTFYNQFLVPHSYNVGQSKQLSEKKGK
jgi:hypothetical protein